MFFTSVGRKRHARQALILGSFLMWLATAQAQNSTLPDSPQSVSELDTITVSGADINDLLSPTPGLAKMRVQQWPGSVGLIDEADYTYGATLGLGDALRTEPGIFVQSAAGQQSGRLSIRGSGLTSPLGVRGVMLLRDGMPLNQADGSVDPSYADPFNVRYIEVYRGSNALQYGAATLGGAINIVSPTGYSNPGLETRMQVGSYGHFQTQARFGQVFDNGVDAFASISRYQTRGSAENAGQETTRFYGNLGVGYSTGSQGRLHLDLADMNQELSSPLTLAQLRGESSLQSPPPDWAKHRVRTQPNVRLAYQHTLSLGQDERYSFGLFYNDTTFDITGTLVPIHYRTRDYGLTVRGESKRWMGLHENKFVWGASLAQGRSNSQTFGPFTLPGGRVLDPRTQQYEAITTSVQTLQAYAENTFSITPGLAVVTALQAVTATRDRGISVLANPHLLPTYFQTVDHNRRYTGFSPKLGLLWQAGVDTQFFANISRSYEPPTAIEFYNAQGTLEAQKAITFELGSRGSSQRLGWEATLFHSRVKNELLQIPRPSQYGVLSYEGGNIPHSRHTGVELILNGKWPPQGMRGAIEWGLAYTWNRFTFANDAAFGTNRLPMIPTHYGRAHAHYHHASGFYLGPELEFASSAYVDQANTLRAPGYALVHFTVGYTHPSGSYRVYLDARNLADKRYASSSEYRARASSNEAVFNPGMRRSVFAGAQILW